MDKKSDKSQQWAVGRKRPAQHNTRTIRPHPSFTGEDAEEFLRLMQAANYKSQARFCMDMTLRRPTLDMKGILREVRKPTKSLSDNLNQLTARCNTYGWNKGVERRLKALTRQLQVFIEGLQCLGMIGYYMADIRDHMYHEQLYEHSSNAEGNRARIQDLIRRTNKTLDILDELLYKLNTESDEQCTIK